MMRILVTEPIIDSAIDKLRNRYEVVIGSRGEYDQTESLKKAAREFDAIVTMLSNPVNREVLEAGKRLKIVANYAVGYNNIDLDAARSCGIRVANTPGVLTESTAEIALALLLSVARKTVIAENEVRNGEFDGWHPKRFIGLELHGAVLGIVGMGRIGQAMARRAQACGMNILYHNRSRVDKEIEVALEAVYMADLDLMLRKADVLSLHCPLTNDTRHLIDERRIGLMSDHAIIINTARGPVLDEAALARALHDGKLGGAGLDVYEKEPKVHPDLMNAPNTVLLPHIGSATVKSRTAMGNLAADAIIGILDGKPENTLSNLLI